MNRNSRISTPDLVHAVRGFLMGGADIIPGVSGGTVALIVGIYTRLVTAISHFDLHLLDLLRQRRWSDAARHVDFRFLVALGSGIVGGIISLASLMNHLLVTYPQPTFAAFFGLILASSLLVGRAVARWTPEAFMGLMFAAVFAYWLVGRPLLQQPPDGNLYIFFCGVVGICAMILPGISGAFILLILGKYEHITGLLRGVLRGDITGDVLLTIAVFIAGCVCGLIGFSKLLKWLLARQESFTMATLCGFMLGSLRKIWPFKDDVTPEITQVKFKHFENVMPGQLDGPVLLALVLMALAAGLVLTLDHLTARIAARNEAGRS